jgi:hypothetical protein
MSTLDLSVRAEYRNLTRALSALAYQQAPFAMAQALNKVAARVKAAEQQNMRDTFKKPTPFTQNSIGTTRATKATLTATVFVKDIAARYLRPYEVGGNHFLSGRALLNPKDIKLNGYGQLPRGTLAKLKARPDIYIGIIKTRKGPVNGVWQRVTNPGAAPPLNAQGKRLRGLNKGPTAKLKLLIRFGDALPVNKHLHYGTTAKLIIDVNLQADFETALNQAMRTAR